MSWDLVASFMLQLCVTRTHWQTTLGKYFKRVHALPLGKAAQPKIYHPSRGPLLYSCCMLNFSPLAHFELAIESLHILVGSQIKWCYVCFDVVPNNKGGLSFEHKMEISRALLTSTVQRIVPAMMSSPLKHVCPSVQAPYRILLTGTVPPSCQNQSGKTKLLMRKETHFVIRVPPKSDIQFQSGHISSHCLSSPIY